MAKTISLMDLMFFLTETKANPKHVAALILLETPERAGKDFVAKLAASYRKATPRAPFDKVAQFGLTHPRAAAQAAARQCRQRRRQRAIFGAAQPDERTHYSGAIDCTALVADR